jgi:hypothetical protein
MPEEKNDFYFMGIARGEWYLYLDKRFNLLLEAQLELDTAIKIELELEFEVLSFLK